MEPITAAVVGAAITAAVTAAASEAGKDTWSSLRALVGRAMNDDREGHRVVEAVRVEPREPSRMEFVTRLLAQRAAMDEVFAAELRTWLGEATARRASGDVTNTISGSAQVHGSVLQGRDFSGPIMFGGPPQKRVD